MKLKLIGITILSTLLFACTEGNVTVEKQEVKTEKKPVFQNKGHEMVYEMTQKTGTYQDLLNLKDIVFTYTYRTPDQKEDVSIESYIFDGELSHAKYTKRDLTLAEMEGELEQGYDGNNFWSKMDGKEMSDSNAIMSSTFLRKTNFYWFAMMQKLTDPGINYEYIGQDSALGKNYEIVKVTFESADDTPTDIYQLYINPETHLVDQFLFTVVAMKVTTPILMRVQYEEIEGMLLTTHRKYTMSDWEATVVNDVWVEEITKNVQFNQGLTTSDFK